MNTESKSRYKTTNWFRVQSGLRQRVLSPFGLIPNAMILKMQHLLEKGRQPTYTDIALICPDDTKPVPTGFYAKPRFHSKPLQNGSPRLECSRLLNIESASR